MEMKRIKEVEKIYEIVEILRKRVMSLRKQYLCFTILMSIPG